MPDLFHQFIADLELIQGQAITLSSENCFAYLFEGHFAVESTLSDDGRYLVTDVWVAQTNDLPAGQHELLLALLLELNGYAALMHDATFSLDAESRIVLSLAQPLAQLEVDHYLAALHRMLEQTRQMRQIILTIYPVVTIREEASPLSPDRR